MGMKYICENCENEHTGIYGSGRFCSTKCARGFSTKAKRKEINKKISKSLLGNKNLLGYRHKEKTKEVISKKIKIYFTENPGESSRRLIGRKHSEETKKKISKSNQGKTGGYREKGGRGKQGWFCGIYCNSSWELAFVIYCKDHNIEIKRNLKGFEYMFENKLYKFYPDFIINNEYVEVKAYFDKKNQAKISQFKNILYIIDKIKILPYIKYVEEKYGNNFIRLYEK